MRHLCRKRLVYGDARLTDKQFFAAYDFVCGYTQSCIDNRYPCGEGGWIHYRVTEREHMNDALVLLDKKLTKE